MKFNPDTDKIAITIPKFTLLRHSDSLFQKYNEPYIVSVAVDASSQAHPEIDFNFMPFPNVAKGDTITMLGDGHLIYGPKNPGDFVAVSVLVMENDREVRDLGAKIETVVQSKAVDLGIQTVIATNPSATVALALLRELTLLVAGFLKENKDDQLFRTEGAFLKGKSVPYDINRSYTRGNDFVNLNLNVIPLEEHNRQGPAPKAIFLDRENAERFAVSEEVVRSR